MIDNDKDKDDNHDDDEDHDVDNANERADTNLVRFVIVKQAPSQPTSPPAGKGPTDLCH